MATVVQAMSLSNVTGALAPSSQILRSSHVVALTALPVRRRSSSRSVVRASSQPPSTAEAQEKLKELLADAKDKWDAVEDKPTAIVYVTGAIAAIWLSSTLVSAINSVPLLPKFLELVGTIYTGWFLYRYVLFKSSRKELAALVEDLKSKVSGTKDA